MRSETAIVSQLRGVLQNCLTSLSVLICYPKRLSRCMLRDMSNTLLVGSVVVLSMWQSLVGAGVLVVKDGRVLMILRDRSGETRWELPSGLTEGGESLEQTAIRETLEEVGVPVAIERLLCTAVMDVPDEEYRGINAYFRAIALDDTTPTPSDGSEPIHKAAYVDLTTLRPKQIHPVDRRILNLWKRKPDRPPFYVHIIL